MTTDKYHTESLKEFRFLLETMGECTLAKRLLAKLPLTLDNTEQFDLRLHGGN